MRTGSLRIARVPQPAPDVPVLADAATVVPVQVDGRTVGTLIIEGGMPVEATGTTVDTSALLDRVNRAIWLAALLAGAVGLALGGALAYGLTRPLNRLTGCDTRHRPQRIQRNAFQCRPPTRSANWPVRSTAWRLRFPGCRASATQPHRRHCP